MVRHMGKAVGALLVAVIVTGSGCANRPDTTISQLDPYVGGRPRAIARLPRPVIKKPPVIIQPSGEQGWIPRGGISKRWDSIVVHHSASDRSTPQGMRDWHVNGRGWVALGYHFVIGNGIGYGDGKVYVGERWRKQMHGAHCKTPGNHYNNHGIGICLIGDLQSHRPTPRQIDALSRLISFLMSKTHIPRSRIFTHGGITGKTECPGRYFSLRPVLQKLTTRRLSAASNERRRRTRGARRLP